MRVSMKDSPTMHTLTLDELLRENENLRRRLDEVDAAVRAIRAGEVDAVLVEGEREQVYTLETADNSYRLLVAQVHQAAVTLTQEGLIVSCNRRFGEVLGRTASSLRGRSLSEFVADESKATLERMLRDGCSEEIQDFVTLVGSDGTLSRLYLGVRPIREGALGLCLMLTDLTEHRHYEELQRAQEALRASEERYRYLFESIDQGFCVIEVLCDEHDNPVDYRFLETNPSFENQTGMQEVVGRTMRELRPNHEDYWFQTYGEVALTGTPIRFQARAASLNRWYDVFAFRVGDPAERKVAILFHDNTAQRQTEEALRAADRRKDEFLATLAHELRNPLAPIRNAVQILQEKGPPIPELQWARGVIDRQVLVMARLLEDLLDVSRISRQRLELRTELLSLTTVVDAALETSRPVIEAAGHELTVTVPTAPLQFMGDPVRLEQVLSNLLNNAAKYTEGPGRIVLTAVQDGKDVVISVKDNGIGIDEAMVPELFRIFSQQQGTHGRTQEGLGIGLSLVKGLVELHGGSVSARSDGPGKGSEFIVRLPLAAATPLKDAEPAEPDDLQQSRARYRILIADDNRDGADSLAMLLQVKGHEVETAYAGDQAVEIAEQMRPDAILLDIGMPKLNGYEACRRIRAEPWGRDIVLIALTGWGQEDDRRRTREASFDLHLVKPVDSVDLLKTLASVLGDRTNRRRDE
jgi:PAS domain S-box-containing protein